MSTRQPDITIRSVRSHYQTQPTPGTQNTTHQITARHNKKPIGQYKPIPLPDKLAIAFSDEEPVELLDRIAKIDFEARKLVYQYLKLMLTI